MKLWMSAEEMRDVGDMNQIAQKEIAEYVNGRLTSQDYGKGVEKWAVILIILPAEVQPAFPEVLKYHAQRKVAEFRLWIDHANFKSTDDLGRRKLICQALERSLELFPKAKVKDSDYERLWRDFRLIVSEKGWL